MKSTALWAARSRALGASRQAQKRIQRFCQKSYSTTSMKATIANQFVQSIKLSEFVAAHRPTWAEIDLNAVRHNVREFFTKAFSNPKHVVAVVKADAYGHGAAEVGAAALSAGAKLLAVATVDEGIELRLSTTISSAAPILVMGLVGHGVEESYLKYNLIPTIHNINSAQRIAAVAKRHNKQVKVHLKIDTGMGRIGFLPKDVEHLASTLTKNGYGKPNTDGWVQYIDIEGVFTHFSKADEAKKDYSKSQVAKFFTAIKQLHSFDIYPTFIHLANSAGAVESPDIFHQDDHHPEAHSLLRLGISLYGYYPSNQVNRTRISLQPVMSWKSKIIQVKRLPPGERVSYGGHYKTQHNPYTVVATLPVGYADGYRRLLGAAKQPDGTTKNHGWSVLLRGHRAPIIGRVCMDMFMVDATEVERKTEQAQGPISENEVVTLMGQQGSEAITCDEMADKLGTITYEITCLVGKRVPRLYKDDDGKIIAAKSLLGRFLIQDDVTSRANSIK